MKFFIDTANLEQIKEMQALGIIDGVTTNPTLLAKEGADPTEQLKKICEIVDGPVSGEVIGLTTNEMVNEARELAKIAPNIVVKIPFTKDGIKAVNILEDPVPGPGELEANHLSARLYYPGRFLEGLFYIGNISQGKADCSTIEGIVRKGEALRGCQYKLCIILFALRFNEHSLAEVYPDDFTSFPSYFSQFQSQLSCSGSNIQNSLSPCYPCFSDCEFPPVLIPVKAEQGIMKVIFISYS